MKIAVMGAGAVGCYYGAMLARAGHEVTLVGRAQHVEAVLREGLYLETSSFQGRLRLQASTDASAVRGARLVLFCVKSPDTERAAAELAPYLEPEARLLSLQNGVDNAERLSGALAREVIPAVVYVATEMAAPGHVRHHGRGELVLGASPSSEEIAALLNSAGVPAEVSGNVMGALWAKLVVNCAYNALSAIAQRPYGELVRATGVSETMHEVVKECLAVARAAQVRVPERMWESVQRIAQTMPAQLSSTAQDLARGKPTEIDHLNGYVVRRGEALGVATPVNRALHALVKLLEEKRAAAQAR